MDISILVPTKNRPGNITKLLKSISETYSGKYEIEVLFFVDNDDANTNHRILYDGLHYFKNSDRKLTINIFSDESQDWYNNWWQYLYLQSKGNYIMLCGDDNVFLTKNWDEIVINKFKEYEDKIVLVNCNDGSPDFEDRATHPFVTRKWCETLGYFTPGIFKGGFNDTWLTEIAKDIGRFVTLKDVVIEHNHPDFKKSNWDTVYERQKQLVLEQNAKNLFENTKIKRKEDSEKLKKEINKILQ